MVLLVTVPSEISLSVAVLKRELGAGIRCVSPKPANGQCCIITFSSPPFCFYVCDQLCKFTRWKSLNGRNYRVTVKFLLDCAKCSMGCFCRIIRTR